MTVVRRYADPMGPNGLIRTLRGLEHRQTEALSIEIPLEPLTHAITTASADLSGSALDSALIEPLHHALAGLSRREAADIRLWHWLCVDQFSEIVARRWSIQIGHDKVISIKPGDIARFLGSDKSLQGMARNTLARLWWLPEVLGDYDLARAAVKNQDRYVNIFERAFGLVVPAAKASVRRFGQPDVREDDWRSASKWLQQRVPTTIIEALDEAEITEILDQSLSPAAQR